MKLADATERTMAILTSGTMASGEIAGGNFAERLSIAKCAEITKPFLKPFEAIPSPFTSTVREVGANLSSTSPTANVPSALTRRALLYNLSLEKISNSLSYIGVRY